MKLSKKWRGLSLHMKLLCYFLSFGALIVVVLLIFQSFFLEGYYTTIKRYQVEKNASVVAESLKESHNIVTTIENVASYNSLCVYVYETTSFFKLIYGREYDNPATKLDLRYHEIYNYYRMAEKNNNNYICITQNSQKALSRFDESPFFRGSTSDNAERTPVIRNTSENQNMVYAEILNLKDGTECMLLVTSSITPLDNTMEIVREQIYIIIFVFVLLSLVFSLYASIRIANPISKTNKAAKELARKNYDVDFNADGYLEVRELNDTLNYAKSELAATEKLQKELIANISHDLRTPLTMISGYAEVMRDLPGENTPENVQIIIDETNRLSSLVNDLLDLSKLQSGAIKPEMTDFSLTDSVDNIFLRYTKLKEQDGYNISFECNKNVTVFADELKISQVLYNLINNAINHAGDDKTVIVRQLTDGKRVRIEVSDNGDGIAPEQLQNIWDRYYKVDKSQSHKRGVIGTGLGLSIVKSILDAHNARYGVRSTLGEGSTFWFELDVKSIDTDKN